MAAIQLDLPEDQIEAINRLAERQGMSPTEWLLGIVARESQKTRRRSKYSVEELLAGADPTAPLSTDEAEWLNAPLAGREVI